MHSVPAGKPTSIMTTGSEHDVELMQDGFALYGVLGIPTNPSGAVLFAHGSGSGRLSPRNTVVARYLQNHGLATLLLDLLRPDESEDRQNVFNIDLLAERLLLATTWLGRDTRTTGLPIGLFGASTGAGAALQAAAKTPLNIHAVVSRGGRPDLADAYLSSVTAPTLLIVGGNDDPVVEMNRLAYERLTCEKHMIIVPGATHLFEEPGTLEQVAEDANRWFLRFLTKNRRA
jgi:putative phosphoribosyl transferase